MKIRKYLPYVLVLGFLLGIHNGKIALWKDNDPTPVRIFPYEAKLLPEADQKALRKGIHIDSLTQLKKLLEDYLS